MGSSVREKTRKNGHLSWTGIPPDSLSGAETPRNCLQWALPMLTGSSPLPAWKRFSGREPEMGFPQIVLWPLHPGRRQWNCRKFWCSFHCYCVILAEALGSLSSKGAANTVGWVYLLCSSVICSLNGLDGHTESLHRVSLWTQPEEHPVARLCCPWRHPSKVSCWLSDFPPQSASECALSWIS